MNPVERFGWLCLAAVYFAVVVAIGHTVGVVAMADDVGLFAGMVCGMGLGVAAVLFTLLVVAAVTASISGEEQ